jgi:hypothetical protein
MENNPISLSCLSRPVQTLFEPMTEDPRTINNNTNRKINSFSRLAEFENSVLNLSSLVRPSRLKRGGFLYLITNH